MARPIVSFLIPVYNAENFVAATLDSIVEQDDGGIEIICVNDGSTDNSESVLKRYSKKYPFIHAIQQNNGGITKARNAALDSASGEWVYFVDNDDIVAEGTVETLHKNIEADLDIVYFNYERFTSDLPNQAGNSAGVSRLIEGSLIAKLQSDCINRFRSNKPLISHKVLPTPWAKAYRRSFIASNNVKFRPDIKHEEDIIFNLELLSYCKRVKVVDFVSYYYRWHVASESHRYRPQIFSDVKITLDTYKEIIDSRYSARTDMRELYQYRILWDLLYCVVLGPLHPGNKATYAERRAQFFQLFIEYPRFAEIFEQVSVTKFDVRQSILATLIKYRQFFLLNCARNLLNKAR